MPQQVLDISVSTSSDIVHVGDYFLMYVTIRNVFEKVITEVIPGYDLPKGFLIFKLKDPAEKPSKEENPHGFFQGLFISYRNLIQETAPEPLLGQWNAIKWDVQIQPGDTYTIAIPIQAGGLLFRRLRPDTYHLAFDVRFKFDGEQVGHIQQVKTDLIIYNRAFDLYLGAILGGVVGTYLRKPQSNLFELVAGAGLGFVLVIVFRRKSNVQSFIAIEDLWGGFLVGLIAGYGGQEILNQYLSPPGARAN